MTDKQIIIDGVDVAECEHFDDGECLNPCETVTVCEASINCRYKQLKRKEQECETLASQLDFEVQKKECLEQECERLKEILDELFKVQFELADSNKKLRQCLAEIREICEPYRNSPIHEFVVTLQKISEYEVNDV